MTVISSKTRALLWHDPVPREVSLRRIITERPPPSVDDCIVATYFFAFRTMKLEKAVGEIRYHATIGVKNPPPCSLLEQCAAKSLVGQFLFPCAEETVAVLERIPLDAPNHDRAEWRAINVPTLVLANRHDPIHPFEYGETLAREIPGEVLRAVRSHGKKAGVSVLLTESVDQLKPHWADLDIVTFCGTAMGIKGANMDPECLEKTRQARAIIDKGSLPVEVESDGGIRRETVPLLKAAGTDFIVPRLAHVQGRPENNAAMAG